MLTACHATQAHMPLSPAALNNKATSVLDTTMRICASCIKPFWLCRWVVPALWGPAVMICLLKSLQEAEHHWMVSLLLVVGGVLQWQLLEYCIHRCAMAYLPALLLETSVLL